jgi:hypothetical protein
MNRKINKNPNHKIDFLDMYNRKCNPLKLNKKIQFQMDYDGIAAPPLCENLNLISSFPLDNGVNLWYNIHSIQLNVDHIANESYWTLSLPP